MVGRLTSAALTAVGLLVGFGIGLGAARPAQPRLVSAPGLRDLALADSNQIFINFPRMAEYSPPLANFFLLHEQGHIALGHRPIGTARMRQAAELEADCWAARRASVLERDVAVTFFERLGTVAFDSLHPRPIDRAAKVAACGQ